MSSIFLVLQFVLAVAVAILVLLQKSASLGLGAYSGSNESLFGAKGPAGFLAKLTFVLGVLFVANTITLGYFYNQSFRGSVVQDIALPKSSIPSAQPAANATGAGAKANATGAATGAAPSAPAWNLSLNGSVPAAPTAPANATPATPKAPAANTTKTVPKTPAANGSK